jgi:hypothetical protein
MRTVLDRNDVRIHNGITATFALPISFSQSASNTLSPAEATRLCIKNSDSGQTKKLFIKSFRF